MSFHQVRELFEARLIVEGEIAGLAARRATEEEILVMESVARVSQDSEQPSRSVTASNIEIKY
ncbi:MAG: FCD domain-containing protein, partial [Acidobacteriota bacterium]|nr:FCD domain-containing protein [Acidobacteriota bacterium]